MQSRKHIKSSKGRWDNSPEGLRRRRAIADAKREAMVADLPPVPIGPEPLSLWQSITVELYVPINGRCDQHATVVDGERVGLLSATQIGVLIRDKIRKRPSVALLAEERRFQ